MVTAQLEPFNHTYRKVFYEEAAGRHYSTYAVRQSTHPGRREIVTTNRMRCRQYTHKRESGQRGNIWNTGEHSQTDETGEVEQKMMHAGRGTDKTGSTRN